MSTPEKKSASFATAIEAVAQQHQIPFVVVMLAAPLGDGRHEVTINAHIAADLDPRQQAAIEAAMIPGLREVAARMEATQQKAPKKLIVEG